MTIRNLTPGGYAANCYLLSQEGVAVLIDATADPAILQEQLRAQKATLAAILLTHGHFDHLLRLLALKQKFQVPIYLHKGDLDLPEDPEKNASACFLTGQTFPAPDHVLRGNEQLCFGALALSVLHTPGHTRGSVVYRAQDIAFTGDTLFAGGYGRTDLYGGDHATLRASLALLGTLPPQTRIFPGHGEDCDLASAFAF